MYTVQWNTETDLGDVVAISPNKDMAIASANEHHADHPERNVYVTTSEPDANGITDGTIYETGCDSTMKTVQLIETNGGTLFIGTDSGPWFDMTELPAGQFAEDAEAYANGDTDDWTVDSYDARPMGDVVAEWDGSIKIVGNLGIAGAEYVGVDIRA